MSMSKIRNRYFGDRDFYKYTLSIAVPMIIQNGITNFVSLLDNIMVGRIGTEQMSGVAISNQLMFVFCLCVFGAVSGAGIFAAQFHGSGDYRGVRSCFRFKIMICTLIAIASGILFFACGDTLISLFLTEDATGDIAATLGYGFDYLKIMIIGLLPFTLTQAYSSTLREVGETKLPMYAGVAAVFVNLVFNYILIFGKFGAPALGADGAAIATVISRFVELGIVVIGTHRNDDTYRFIHHAYRSMHIPSSLVRGIMIKGMPLMVNELLWSAGVSVIVQCYSTRGLSVVAGYNIASTAINLFNVLFMAFGNSVAIIVGQELGAGKKEKAMDSARKLIVFSVIVALIVSLCIAVTSPFIPMLYNTEDNVRSIATSLLIAAAICTPLHAFAHASYFTIRSGGKTFITFLFDSVYTWGLSVPFAYILSRFTDLPIFPLYLFCQLIDIIKCVIGYILVEKGIWVNNIVEDKKHEPEAGEV